MCFALKMSPFIICFIDCIVARNIWPLACEHFNVQLGGDFESIARFWVSSNRNSALNTASAAVMWCLWKYRNSMIFNSAAWLFVHQVLKGLLSMVKAWSILSLDLARERLSTIATKLVEYLQDTIGHHKWLTPAEHNYLASHP